MMLAAGMLPGGKPVFNGTIKAPPHGPTVQYGEYILSFQDCRECHGADLKGGVQGQLPPVGPGLGFVKDWKLQDFITTMRTGIDPTGHEISKQMPWQPIGKIDGGVRLSHPVERSIGPGGATVIGKAAAGSAAATG
jgi:hypothetical protein